MKKVAAKKPFYVPAKRSMERHLVGLKFPSFPFCLILGFGPFVSPPKEA
jgi:hypothetical protein